MLQLGRQIATGGLVPIDHGAEELAWPFVS